MPIRPENKSRYRRFVLSATSRKSFASSGCPVGDGANRPWRVKAKDARDNEKFMEERLFRLMTAFERIADAMELWADQQEPPK